MGNLRSVEKALEHVGATATITSDPAEVARRRRPDPARRRRLPAGDGADPRARPRRADRRAPRGRRADPRHLPRPAAALRLDHRARRRRRASACSRARSRELEADGLKVPHIGWSPVRWERESRLTEGIESRDALLLRPLLRAPARAASELLGSAAYGARFACAAERDNVFGVQFHPEKSSAAGLRLLANFAGVCARRRRRRDPLPGHRHPRRPGGAPAAGRLRARDRLRRRPGRRREALGRRRRRVPARRRPRRRARRASRRTSTRCAGSPPRSSARSRSAAACATRSRSTRCSRPGRAGRDRHRRAARPGVPRRGAGASTASGSWSRSTPAAARSRSPAGPRPATSAPPRRSPS